VAVAILCGCARPALAADPVQRIEVRLTVEDGEPHPLVVRRIADSVGSAAERLLVGRDSEVVARQEAQLVAVLRDVVDRVVRGYRVVAMSFDAGTLTVVSARLAPRPPTFAGDVLIDVAAPTVHPDAQPLVRTALNPALPRIRDSLGRLPIDALEWARPILEQEATRAVEATLEGFTGTARIEGTPGPRVVLSLAPRDSRVIRDIGVRFRSTSIPYMLLGQHSPQVASMAEPLRGLPVTFATAHRARFEELIAQRLAAYPPVREFAIIARPLLQVAEVTYVTVIADSTLYRGRLEARLNIGSQAPPPDVRAQIGRAFGSLEPYAQLTLTPSTLGIKLTVGLKFEIGQLITVGVETSADSGGPDPFATLRVSPDIQLRGSYMTRDNILETSITYRLNEFISLEGVGTSRGIYWLRIVSNL
jgi:hypothetical protein